MRTSSKQTRRQDALEVNLRQHLARTDNDLSRSRNSMYVCLNVSISVICSWLGVC